MGGIGAVAEQLLGGLGVTTCGDLLTHRAELRMLFSEQTTEFYLAAGLGLGSNRLEPPEQRERKSIRKHDRYPALSASVRSCSTWQQGSVIQKYLFVWISDLPLSVETSFRETSDRSWLLETLAGLCRDLAVDCKGKEITGTALTVKV